LPFVVASVRNAFSGSLPSVGVEYDIIRNRTTRIAARLFFEGVLSSLPRSLAGYSLSATVYLSDYLGSGNRQRVRVVPSPIARVPSDLGVEIEMPPMWERDP